MATASEIGLIAKLDPQVSDDGVETARKEVEKGITRDPLEVGVEVDRSGLDEAQKRIQELQEQEPSHIDPTTGREVPERYQRQRKIRRIKDRVKESAKTAGSAAKQSGVRGSKFLGKVTAAKAMRKMGIPATVPQNQLFDTMMPSGGSGGVATGAGEGGSAATEPDRMVPLLQSQLEVQEEILDLLEMDDSGGSSAASGAASGGGGGGGGILSMLGLGKLAQGGLGGAVAGGAGYLGAKMSGALSWGRRSSRMMPRGGKFGSISKGLGRWLGRSPYTLLSQTADKRNVADRAGKGAQGPVTKPMSDIATGDFTLSEDFWPSKPDLSNYKLKESFWPDIPQILKDIRSGSFTLSEDWWPDPPQVVKDIRNGNFTLSEDWWPDIPQVVKDIWNGNFTLTESFWPSKPGWLKDAMRVLGMNPDDSKKSNKNQPSKQHNSQKQQALNEQNQQNAERRQSSSSSGSSGGSENKAKENTAQVNNTFRFDISVPANAAAQGLDQQTKRQVHDEIDRRFRELERRANLQ